MPRGLMVNILFRLGCYCYPIRFFTAVSLVCTSCVLLPLCVRNSRNVLPACEKMRKCKTHISRASDVLIVFLMDFSVVSDVSGVIWEEWWTYDGISGEPFSYIKLILTIV